MPGHLQICTVELQAVYMTHHDAGCYRTKEALQSSSVRKLLACSSSRVHDISFAMKLAASKVQESTLHTGALRTTHMQSLILSDAVHHSDKDQGQHQGQ